MKCGSSPACRCDANRFPEALESLPRRQRALGMCQQGGGRHGSPLVRPSPLGCILPATPANRLPRQVLTRPPHSRTGR